jgi:hypothetical protein
MLHFRRTDNARILLVILKELSRVLCLDRHYRSRSMENPTP